MAGWMMKLAATAAHKRSADAAFPITVSKETTWITKPLYPNGAVNYVAALNERLSEGVTPNNNAAVLLIEVMGAKLIPKEIRAQFYQHLGIPLPEKTQGDLQSYADFLDEYLKTTGAAAKKRERTRLLEKSFETQGRPWTRKEYPLVGRWLDSNKAAINRIVAASRRPRLYVPIVPKDQDDGLLVLMFMLEFNSNMREFARILSSRAMLSLGEGRIEDAQRDLLACHRLGRLLGNGSSIINYFVGTALGDVARGGDLILAERTHQTPAGLAKHREEIANLPAFASMSEMYDVSERFGFLDFVRVLALESRKPEAEALNPAVEVGEFLDFPHSKVWKQFPELELDWDLILKIGNQRFNQVVEALKRPTFPERKVALQKIKDEVMQLRKESQNPREVALLVWRKKPAREIISRQFGNELAWMMLENAPLFAEVEARVGMKRQMVLIALALAEYHREQGKYPPKLSALAPKYLPKIPRDAFSLKPLKYQPRKDGYLLYCVGSNGEDDKGDADDVAIRVPRKVE